MLRIALTLLVLNLSAAFAVETDQFLAWGSDLQDSTTPLNQYLNQTLQRALSKVNHQMNKSYSCEEVAYKVMTEIKGPYKISAISLFAGNSPKVDRYPKNEFISDSEYEKLSIHNRSIYRNYFVKLGRTIKVNGVLMGTDKLGHMFLIGRAYYKSYLEKQGRFSDEDFIQEQIIQGGVTGEYYLLGYIISGVFSFGDLEANFQGLQFAKRLCKGTNPYLKFEEGQWVQKVSVDLKEYVNAYFDESFNTSAYNKHKFKLIKPALMPYCGRLHPLKEEYERRFVKSKNLKILSQFKSGQEILKLKKEQSFENICQ
jgi:hypothetical protein